MFFHSIAYFLQKAKCSSDFFEKPVVSHVGLCYNQEKRQEALMQLNYGILSTSSIAPRFLAALRQSGTGQAIALSSRDLAKAQALADQWQIPTAYGSHDALLADDRINIVYISCINSAHYTWAKAALLAGKHVICEKPCTTTAAQTQELFALAKEKGLFLMEAQKMLFLPAVCSLRQHIENGDLGQITMVELSHSFSAAYNNWMYEPSSGGPLYSSGIYAVQLLQWLFGPIEDIRGVRSAMENGVEWQYMLTGTTESGTVFCAKNSTRVALENTAKFYGTAGWVELPEYWKARKAIFHIQGKEPEVLEFPCVHELSYEAAHIQSCLDAGLLNSPVVTEAVSVNGIAALEAVRAQWDGESA
jgi:predicted dehydrogenase